MPDAARLERLDLAVDEIDPVGQLPGAHGSSTTWPHRRACRRRSGARFATSPSTSPGPIASPAAARLADAGRLVFVSSGGAIYGDSRQPAGETTTPAPASYYGIHKLAAEGHVALSGLPYAIARPSNIYGPRQASGLEGAVVAAFVGQALAGQALTIDGDGLQTRDFVHVRDVVDALVRLGDVDGPVGTWNVAVGRRTSIEALANAVERAVGVQLGRDPSPGPRR